MQHRDRGGAEVLLTGATGFLGKVVLHELARRAEELGFARVHAAVRPRGRRDAATRLREEVLASPCFSGLPAGWEERVEPVPADLAKPGCGLDPAMRARLTERVTHVIHCAASVEFDLPVALAAEANVTTALHVLELARDGPTPARMVSVSTAYATPHPGDGVPVEERLAPLPEPAAALLRAIRAGRYDAADDEAALLAATRHPNTYTLTKCLAEHLLAERAADVELALVRPSIIAAGLRRPLPGWIDSPAAFALFAMMIGSGRMHAVIADPRARLDLVPVDFVADRLVEAAFGPRPPEPGRPRIVHAVAGLERSPTLRACSDGVSTYFERTPLEGAPPARLHYAGPDGWRFRLHHRRLHERHPEIAAGADRLADTARRFAYFSHHTFDFRSSAPLDDPAFEPHAYLETVCRGVYRHLLGGDERAVVLAGADRRRRRSRLAWVLHQPHGNAFVRLAAYLVDAALHRAAERITLDVESFRASRAEVPEDAALVLAPSHRSYLDFVLTSYLCFARPDLGIPIPHVAAAVEFARIPLLGRIFRRLHAFYLARGRGREDKRVTAEVHRLVRSGRALEFFIEGQRSRSRRFLPPRRGLLRSLQATGTTVAVLPVAVAYERVPEEATFREELRGAPKPPMRLRDLLAWCGRLLRGRVELGRVHVAAGRPVPLDLARDVHAVSRDVVRELQAAMPATTEHLRAFCAANPDLGASGVDPDWLAAALERRGARVIPGARRPHPVPPEIERTFREHLAWAFFPEAECAGAPNPAVEHHVRRYGYARPAGLDVLDVERELADPRVAAVLRALFEPLAQGYATAGRALGPAGAPGDPLPVAGPEALTRSLADGYRPDVDDAFDDLEARGVLARSPTDGRWVWGPRSADLEPWIRACEGNVGERSRFASEHRSPTYTR